MAILGISRVQVNFRCARRLRDRVDEIATQLGTSRNDMILQWVSEGIARVDADPGPTIYGLEAKAVADDIERIELNEAIVAAGPERQSDKPHRHRFTKVEGSQSPSRLLGETEATYECVCGKSERRKVPHGEGR